MQLTGRDSLIRLIGKRRRFLPNRHSILSSNPYSYSNTIQSALNLSTDDDNKNNGGSSKAVELEQPLQQPNLNQFQPSAHNNKPENGCEVQVHCPICGCKVPDEINSHLDVCLSRGTKRKLTQRTLLQLNFSRISKEPIVPGNLGKSDNVVILRDPYDHISHNLLNASSMLAAEEEIENNKCELTETLGIDHKIDCTIGSSSSSLMEEMPKCGITTFEDNIFGVTLETFIVGRRFAGKEEIHPGAAISLLRDPGNVKDSNAIKVVSADSACCKLLGFLSRELAQYLSPLIDKYGLGFEGFVTSVPKHSLDVVPIQIMCQGISDGESEYKDETFKCLWKNVQHVVEFARNNPPSSVKYQLNFCLILQEVLRNNGHLLTEDEKTYMGSFTLLSNDSQRLFIRLYTRKGSPREVAWGFSSLEGAPILKATTESDTKPK